MTLRKIKLKRGLKDIGYSLQNLHHHFEKHYPKYRLVSVYDDVKNTIELRLIPITPRAEAT